MREAWDIRGSRKNPRKLTGVQDTGVFRILCDLLPGGNGGCRSGEVLWERDLQAFASVKMTLLQCARTCSGGCAVCRAESLLLQSAGLGVKLASALISFSPHVSPCSANRASYSIICNCKSPRALESRGFFFFFHELGTNSSGS